MSDVAQLGHEIQSQDSCVNGERLIESLRYQKYSSQSGCTMQTITVLTCPECGRAGGSPGHLPSGERVRFLFPWLMPVRNFRGDQLGKRGDEQANVQMACKATTKLRLLQKSALDRQTDRVIGEILLQNVNRFVSEYASPQTPAWPERIGCKPDRPKSLCASELDFARLTKMPTPVAINRCAGLQRSGKVQTRIGRNHQADGRYGFGDVQPPINVPIGQDYNRRGANWKQIADR